jgi:predicted RNA-binding protein
MNLFGGFTMCEAHAYMLKDGEEEVLLENVDQVEVAGDEVRLINIFGEQKILKAQIKSYNNTERKILLEALQ